jgi:hypothetical protein
MTVRTWWDMRASPDDQATVLRRLDLSEDIAGLPWAFLPDTIQVILSRRLRITLPDNAEADERSR